MKKYLVILATVITSILLLGGCGKNPSEEGLELLQEGQYEAALSKFEEAIEDEKNIDDAYRGVGIAKWELEDYEGARDAFENALSNGTEETATIYHFLGSCELRLENYKMALNYFRLGMLQEDCNEEMMQEMRFNEIVALEKIGDWESARTELNEYIVDYPEDERAVKEAEFLETR